MGPKSKLQSRFKGAKDVNQGTRCRRLTYLKLQNLGNSLSNIETTRPMPPKP